MNSHWDELRDGVAGPHDIKIRVSRSRDRAAVAQLLRSVVRSDALETLYKRLDDLGTLVAAFSRADAAAVTAFWRTEQTIDSMMTAGSFILVGERDRTVIGALCAGMPWRAFRDVAGKDDTVGGAIVMASLARLNAVAVAPTSRRSGTATALIKSCVTLLDGAGYGAIMGQCTPDLAPFYAARGFALSRPGEPISLLQEVPTLPLIGSNDPAEYTFVQRLRPFPNEHTPWRLSWLTPQAIDDRIGGEPEVTAADENAWETTILNSTGSLVPVLRMTAPEEAGRTILLESRSETDAATLAPSTFVGLLAKDGKAIVHLNDSSAAAVEDTPPLLVVEPLSEDDWPWIQAVSDRGWSVFTIRETVSSTGVSGLLGVTFSSPIAPPTAAINTRPGLLARIRGWLGR